MEKNQQTLELNETHLKELESFLKKQPWEFSQPIFTFLAAVKQEQEKKRQEEIIKDDLKVKKQD